MRHKSYLKRSVSACAFIAGCTVLGGGTVAQAQGAPAQKKAKPTSTKRAIPESEVLRRLQDLEAQVAQYRQETARLQAELAQRQGAAPAQAKPAATKTAAAGGEWDEPEVDKKPEGRDEEARRRLLVIETQARKNAAETAKLEEQNKDKFKLDLSGKYKTAINARKNFNLDNPNQLWPYDNATYFDQRFQLTLDATYESFLTRLTLDQGNFVFDWKEDSQGTQSRWGEFLTVNSQLVRELFVQYTGPFMVRVGRQNWDVGHSIVLEGPLDALRLQYPLGQMPWGQTIANAGYLAPGGGWNSYQNFHLTGGPPAGNRSEVLGAATKLNAYYLDLDVRPSRAMRVRPYLIKIDDKGGTTGADLNLDKDFNRTTTPRDGNFRPLWAGLAFSADTRPWKFDAEAVSLSGDITSDRKVSAYALFGKAARDLGKTGALGNLTLGLELGRGSGNGTADATSGTLRNYNSLFLCKDRHQFGNIFSQDVRAGYFLWDSNLSNITYVKAEATLGPIKRLTLTPSVSRMWTTKEVFAGAGPVFDWSTGFGRGASTASTTRTTKDVGWEFDLNGVYPLLKHVNGFFNFGYFRPGPVYARADGSNPRSALKLVVGAEIGF